MIGKRKSQRGTGRYMTDSAKLVFDAISNPKFDAMRLCLTTETLDFEQNSFGSVAKKADQEGECCSAKLERHPK